MTLCHRYLAQQRGVHDATSTQAKAPQNRTALKFGNIQTNHQNGITTARIRHHTLQIPPDANPAIFNAETPTLPALRMRHKAFLQFIV